MKNRRSILLYLILLIISLCSENLIRIKTGSLTAPVLAFEDADELNVIDKRIDVFAQKSLLRMLHSDANSSADSKGMLFAVKSGELGGIYKVDQRVPALRAQKYGHGWWQLIPGSEDAVLFLDPSGLDGGKPIIVFKNNIRSVPVRIDSALRKAWISFKLLNEGNLVKCGDVSKEVITNIFPANSGMCISGEISAKDKIIPACQKIPTESVEFTIWLQRALNNALGITLTLDGVFGNKTKSALKSFQKRENLLPSGDIDNSAQYKLSSFISVPIPCQVSELSCPKGAFSGTVKEKNIDFRFCWSTLAFYPRFKGHVELDSKNKSKIIFSCHREEVCKKQLIRIPGWRYEAAVVAEGPGLGKPGNWEYGFVQTVRAADWKAVYSGGNGLECNMKDTRDAFIVRNIKDRPPWYIDDGNGVQQLGNGKTVKMEDSPHAVFPILNPSDSKQKLNYVCFNARFDIWLVAKRIKDPLSINNLVILAHKNIVVQRQWKLRTGATDPGSEASWLRFGGHHETGQGKGSGPSTPVLKGLPASKKVLTCFKKKSDIKCKRPPFFSENVIGGCSP